MTVLRRRRRPGRIAEEEKLSPLVKLYPADLGGERGSFKGVERKRQFVVLNFLIRVSWHNR
jgi:hypothetical protein